MIQLGFSTSNAWYSKWIRWFTKSKVSHVFIVADWMGRRIVLEEGPFGYSTRTLESLAANDTIVELYTPPHDISAALAKSLDDLGSFYGYFVLIGMFFVMLGRFFGKKIRNPLTSARAMICSERTAYVLQAAQYPGSETLDPPSTSPEDLLEFLHNTPVPAPPSQIAPVLLDVGRALVSKLEGR